MFYVFICSLITVGYFLHNKVLVMDNATIHTGGGAENIRELLWNTVISGRGINGRALNILVIYLPTCSPELNPIELIFHILARRIRSFRYRLAGPSDEAVVRNTKRVLDEMSYKLILKCYDHCGY
jgi:transposase